MFLPEIYDGREEDLDFFVCENRMRKKYKFLGEHEKGFFQTLGIRAFYALVPPISLIKTSHVRLANLKKKRGGKIYCPSMCLKGENNNTILCISYH